MLGQLVSDVDSFGASLRRNSAVNVNDQSSRDRAIELASRYFRDVRPQIVAATDESEIVLEHDEYWQQLIRLAHGRNARSSYLKIVDALRKQLTEFRVRAIASPSPNAPGGTDVAPSRDETLILETLENLVPSAAASYRQGLSDLAAPERLSYRGTATEFRESLRETLDHLAPDEEVGAASWYQLVENTNRPTMSQKARFVLENRAKNKTQRDAATKAIGVVEQLCGEVTRAVYNRASLATHIQQTKQEVEQMKRYTDTVLFDLLELTHR